MQNDSDRINGNIYEVYSKDGLLKIFPFGRTKMNQLLQAGVLPVVKIGRDYLTNEKLIESWFEENRGKEIFY